MAEDKAKTIPNSNLDVICQHCSDGRIIPIRIRVQDEDGEYHAYNIHDYKNLSHRGDIECNNGIKTHNDIYVFECTITVFSRKHSIRLYYKSSSYTSEWSAEL